MISASEEITWVDKTDMHSDLDLQPNTSKGDNWKGLWVTRDEDKN